MNLATPGTSAIAERPAKENHQELKERQQQQEWKQQQDRQYSKVKSSGYLHPYLQIFDMSEKAYL